ncbi:hypothetical protein [Ketobacter sp.]|uniref:hypothetical protein n=1 Tax=Ketobacter sp. TaxID=2083498 RepID=UPI000F1F3B05|nr:hypothetical protein [Ketobacter sp.]RLU00535.1 MAG: hypothetical protein D9N14_06325 [Ketobacter sp.]
MVKRMVVLSGAVWLLAGCSLFGEMAPGSEEGYFEPRSAATQDPYWERFYALEQEIARLRSKMGEPAAVPQATQVITGESAPIADRQADEFLARLKSKADKAVQVIDQAIAALDVAPAAQEQTEALAAVPEPVTPADYAVTSLSPQVAVAGSVQRGEQGQVVGQVTHSQSRQAKYNYSLVYVYQEPQPWNDMWEKLEEAQERDKWRGSNPAKPSYFIYVGAYYRESDALKRHDTLSALFGEGPEMRANVQSSALASN